VEWTSGRRSRFRSGCPAVSGSLLVQFEQPLEDLVVGEVDRDRLAHRLARSLALVVWIRQMSPRCLIAETTRIKELVVRETPNVGILRLVRTTSGSAAWMSLSHGVHEKESDDRRASRR